MRYDCRMSSSLPKGAKRKKKVGHTILDRLSFVHTSAHLKRLLYIYLVCTVVSAIAAAILASTQQPAKLPDPFSAEQRSVVAFQLYYPSQLPTPYYVDMASLGRTEQSVVTMRITDGKGKGQYFTLTQQRLEDSVNLGTLYESLGSRTSFRTSLGQATTGMIDEGQTRIVSLVSQDRTWILVQAPSNINLEVLQKSLQALTASQ